MMWNSIVGQVIPNTSKELTAFILKGQEVQEDSDAAECPMSQLSWRGWASG